jgi:hypothetical protein
MTEFPVVLVIKSALMPSATPLSRQSQLAASSTENLIDDEPQLITSGGKPVALAPRGYEGALQAIAGALAQRDLIGSVALDALGHAVEQAVAAGGVQHGKFDRRRAAVDHQNYLFVTAIGLLTILNIVYKLF